MSASGMAVPRADLSPTRAYEVTEGTVAQVSRHIAVHQRRTADVYRPLVLRTGFMNEPECEKHAWSDVISQETDYYILD